jgi:hypothetical protein
VVMGSRNPRGKIIHLYGVWGSTRKAETLLRIQGNNWNIKAGRQGCRPVSSPIYHRVIKAATSAEAIQPSARCPWIADNREYR